MGHERWFRGQHDGLERPFDWLTPARQHGIPWRPAQALYEQAVQQARGATQVAEIYLALLADANRDASRPSPGKVTRTMRLEAEKAGKKRRPSNVSGLTGQPIAPGKVTLTSYLARRSAPDAELEDAAWGTHERLLDELRRSLGLADDVVDVRIDDESRGRNEAEQSSGLLADGVVHLHPERYAPEARHGKYLLAHELVHVAQRRLGQGPGALADQGVAEREAHTLATAFAQGQPLRAPAVALSPHAVAADTGSQARDEPGEIIGSYARVADVSPYLAMRRERDPRPLPGDAVAARRDPLVVDLLHFNDRVLVLAAFAGNWVEVMTDQGTRGYIDRNYIIANPPEPGAVLYRTQAGDTALGIAMRHYHGVEWGRDSRFYVNVLAQTNQPRDGRGDVGLYTKDSSTSWQDAQVKEGYWIWIPSHAFAASLHGVVGSGSVSYEAAEAGKSILAFTLGYHAGLFDGIKDALMEVVELVGMVWKALESVVGGTVLADIAELWEAITSLDAGALLDAFLDRWNHQDPWERWNFRGWLIGFSTMLIAIEVLLAVTTGGAGNIARWGARAAKLGKMVDFLKGLGVIRKMQAGERAVGERMPALKKLARIRDKGTDAADAGKESVEGSVGKGMDEVEGAGAKQPMKGSEGDFEGSLRNEKVTLTGVKTRRIRYTKRDPGEVAALRRAFDRAARKEFLRHLVADPDRIAKLKSAGLTDLDIDDLGEGLAPHLYEVHHKLPLDDGGTNDFSNLTLMMKEPYHKVITNAQNTLTRGMRPGESRELDFPVPEGFIYPP